MKTLKLFSAFALFSFLFISCNQDTNAGATYFLENTMIEKLVIPSSQLSTSSTSLMQKDVDLYLSSSSFFNRHIEHLESIDVLSVSYTVNNTSIDLSSSVMKLGDMVVPNFNINSGNSIEIGDVDTLLSIANKLEEDGKITFSFESNLSSSIDLEIDVKIALKGTFVH